MELTSTAEFAADPATVYAMVTNDQFLERAARESGATDAVARVEGQRSQVARVMATPQEVRPFVGDAVTIADTVDWGEADAHGARAGHFTIEVQDQPVSITGAVALAPGGRGTRLTMRGDLSVRIPLLGGRLEHMVAPMIQAVLEAQQVSGDRWLAEHAIGDQPA